MQNQPSTYKKSYTSSVAFLVGALLFLLPFVEIKCNNMTIAHNTGLGLAMGSEFKVSKDMENMGNQKTEEQTDTDKDTKKEKGKMYIVAAIALGLGVIGFLLSLGGSRSMAALNGILAIAAAACLIVLMMQVKPDVENELKNSGGGGGDNPMDQMANTVKPVASFTMWYYLSVVSFLAAAFFSFKKPPTASVYAPQVPINNPGDQSNFPGTPSGEKELG